MTRNVGKGKQVGNKSKDYTTNIVDWLERALIWPMSNWNGSKIKVANNTQLWVE